MSKPGTKVSPPSSASRDFISRGLIIGCLALLILVEFGCAFNAHISEVPRTHVAASNIVEEVEDFESMTPDD